MRQTIRSRGAVRRIRALHALGWRLVDIAAETGYSTTNLAMIAHRDANIDVKKHERINAAYEHLSGSVGPSERTRQVAIGRGWAPPLAWNDIDADDEPRGVRRKERHVLDLDEFVSLVRMGESVYMASKRLGSNPRSILRVAERRGRGDIARLVQHEAGVVRREFERRIS
ncbi:hypothetical protein GCM10025864_39250 [Luteimicrobium album]|uniref:Uncharacterized protein n=1 Tax=Luteimicrobium album TaxID=1054550 RepID=A0ABQ6I660_9MICO|nr:hypothetical protein [Luteimicrobium album]GMA26166.1 hypothetical protein GCM10025864_39250 [Luteimicrobium album]